MGLDMFLTVRKKDNPIFDWNNDVEDVYFRKLNWIRNWLVKHLDLNEDECAENVLVPKEKLEELLSDVRAVLNNHDLAEQLLPTKGGFFFGGTDYSDYYFDSLIGIETEIQALLTTTDFETEDVYYDESW